MASTAPPPRPPARSTRSTQPARPRPAPLPRDTRDTLFLLAVVALIAGQLSLALPLWAGITSLATLAWRAVAAWRSWRLPNRWVLVGLLLAGLSGSALELREATVSGACMSLLLVLLSLKTLEMRARRDHFVMFFLGFFACIVNFLVAQTMLVAAVMLLALVGLLTALVNAHRPAGYPTLRSSARTVLQLLLLGAPAIVALYLLFPRFTPLWGLPNSQPEARTGLSDSMSVGSIADLAQDPSVAMRVRFIDPAGPPPAQALYFRGPVLSQFDGRQWQARPAFPVNPRAVAGTLFNPLMPQARPIDYEVLLEASQRRWLLPLDATTTVRTEPPLRPRQDNSAVWQSGQPMQRSVRYQATSYLVYQLGSELPAAARQADTALPPGGNPRTVEWARQLRAAPDGQDDRTLIDTVLRRLRQGDYRYSLSPGLYGEQTADEFWFDRRTGFCEHIASAFTVLMRAAGIPARVVLGYQGGELNPVDGAWTVRQADAHAWTEVWLDGRGWTRIDPTAAIAPERIEASRMEVSAASRAESGFGTAPDWLWRLRSAAEAADYLWSQWVLNYTPDAQSGLLQRLGLQAWSALQFVALALALVLLPGLLYWLRTSLRPRGDAWTRLLNRARLDLARQGLPVTTATPPREMATLALARWGDAAQPLADWLKAMSDHRYAPAAASGNPALATLRRTWRLLARRRFAN